MANKPSSYWMFNGETHPKWSHFKDTDADTMIQLEESADEDKIRFDVAGSEIMIITDGKVGIGTASPGALLHVKGSGTSSIVKVDSDSGNSGINILSGGVSKGYLWWDNANSCLGVGPGSSSSSIMLKNDNVGIGTMLPFQKLTLGSGQYIAWKTTTGQANSRSWGIRNDYDNFGDFSIRSSNANDNTLDTTRLVIDKDGKVGIGTASPRDKLDVDGSVIIGGYHGQDLLYIERYSDAFPVAGIRAGYADNNEGVGIDLQYRNSAGTPVSGIYLQDDGKVGIGTASPKEKLDVNGAIGFTGLLAGYAAAQDVGTIDYYSGATRIQAYGPDASTRGKIQFYQAGQNNAIGQTPLAIDTAGKIGIGVAVPLSQLHIKQATPANAAAPAGADALTIDGDSTVFINLRTSNNTSLSESGIIFGDDVRVRGMIDYLHRYSGADVDSMRFFTAGSLQMTLDSDGTVTIAQSLTLTNNINEFSTDGNLAGNSDSAVPTEKATKTYVDTQNLWEIVDKIDRGDCESATPPMVTPETVPFIQNMTFARSSEQKRNEDYSYKATKTVAAGTGGNLLIVDNASSGDKHGLVAGKTYTFDVWVYVPTASGIALSEVKVAIGDWSPGWGVTWSGNPSNFDVWEKITLTRTLPAGTTGVAVYLFSNSTADNNEYFYVDDISLYATVQLKNQSPEIINVSRLGIGTVSPQRDLDVSATGQITFGDTVVPNNERGIYWHSGSGYGIYRAAGAWSGDYVPLMIKWQTGIILDPGSGASGKSHVGIVGGLSVGDSYYTTKYDNGLIVQGSVGIGTNNPGAELEVSGSTILGAHDGSDILYINRFSAAAPRAYIVAGDSDRNVPVELRFQTRDDAGFPSDNLIIDKDGGMHMPNMKSGTDQADAGAAANELYFDTNDDNTVKMGV